MKRKVDLGDRKVTLLGTAHVSKESVAQVKEVIAGEKPDLVGVELDQQRFEALKDRSGWKDLDVGEAIKEGKAYLLLFNLILSVYQRRIGLEEGVEPGEEMMSAVDIAENQGIEHALLDRDISETFQRLRDEMGFWEKMMLLASFLVEQEDIEVEELKQATVLDQLVSELENDFPSIKKVFLDERNQYIAEKLLEKDFEHAVVVLGAAHIEGVAEILEQGQPETEAVTARNIPWFKLVKYGFPVAIIGMLAYSFYQIDFATGLQGVRFWILANGLLAAIGAVMARSHPVTWLVAFVSAPLTSLYPALGAGMVAGYVEAKLYPPKVEELESIAYIESYRELWKNQVGRILLTFFLVSIGSSIATFAGAGYIASLIGL